MLIYPSSGACDLFVDLFHGLFCSGTMCVGVTLWFGWGGVVSGYHTTYQSMIYLITYFVVSMNHFILFQIFTTYLFKALFNKCHPTV